MHVVVTVLSVATAAVNTFGAWAVSRRRPMVSRLFLLAAAVVIVAGVAYAYRLPSAFWILTAGAVLTFVASLLNAVLVLGLVRWQNHVARGIALGAILAVAWWALPPA